MSNLHMTFGVVDPAAKSGIEDIRTNEIMPWSIIEQLRYDDIESPAEAYSTFEWNHSILNGLYNPFPDDPLSIPRTWGFWSKAVSNEHGRFADPPILDFIFTHYHKSNGVSLHFYPPSDDWCSLARVRWYSSQDDSELIHSGEYRITGRLGVISEPVADWRRIKIEFLETNIPYRYVKVWAIDFGITRHFYDHEISAARVIEDIDPTGESLSVNTLDCNLQTLDSVFSPITSPDFDNMMMKRQIMRIQKDGKPYGTFFLENWQDAYQSGIVFDLTAIDAIGVFELYQFLGGLYTDKPVVELLDELFEIVFPTGLLKYRLDPAYENATVTGWLPIGTCALALQQICFAIDAIADTARIGDVWIYPRDTEITYHVPLSRQFRNGVDTPTPYFYGVDVFSFDFVPIAETQNVFNNEIAAGQYEMRFSEPLHTLEISGGTIVTAHANYAVFSVPIAGMVSLIGHKYADNALCHSIRDTHVEAGEVGAVKTYDGYTLVTANIAQGLAQSRFSWLQNRINTKNDVPLDDLEVGYMAKLETRGHPIEGTIITLDTNLRANKSTMIVVGNVVRNDLD